MKTFDMIGRPCPMPVVHAKKELQNPGVNGVNIIVDNIIAVQNLEKMAKGVGYQFSYKEEKEKTYVVSIIKVGNINPEQTRSNKQVNLPCEGVTVLVGSNQMGSGSEELGKILIKGFLFSLSEIEPPPREIIFINSGVQLTVTGCNTIEDLKLIQGKGTKIYACGTCLDYYSLVEQLAVGEVTDMYGITTRLANAAKLVTL